MRTSEKIIIKPETDLGAWFGIDGKSIKNQPQLDLAVIALAGAYGFKVARHRDLALVHKFVYKLENEGEELDSEFENLLIASAEVCTQFLNSILPSGYKFTFTGEEYDTLELVKS
jgi:hypothetical protein